MNNTSVVLGEMMRNNNIKIVIRKNIWKEKEYIDIRIFYREKNGNDFLPSTKGISIPKSEFANFLTLLEQTEDKSN